MSDRRSFFRGSAQAQAEPPAPAAHDASLISRALSRSDLLVIACLAAAAGSAWLWLAKAPMPDHGSHSTHMAGMTGMGAEVWSASYLLPAFIMWVLMMAAMMLPSAAPMILLHARVARQSPSRRSALGTTVFAGAYLAVWSLFSAAAVFAQALLVSLDILSPLTLSVGSRTVAAGFLLLAAIYQISPMKEACLVQCRSPLYFVMRLWRPGLAGAFRLGVAHGLYCIGCCWSLMLLLFVGGVMNLAWVALLAAIVFLEKLAPPSWPTSRLVAAMLTLGAVTLLVAG